MDKTVNVAAVGHGFQGGMAIVIGAGNAKTFTSHIWRAGIMLSTRVGKGQRKANKANRWR